MKFALSLDLMQERSRRCAVTAPAYRSLRPIPRPRAAVQEQSSATGAEAAVTTDLGAGPDVPGLS
jgi:hypothetical protein